ncbi:MAG: hypothetical protein AAF409_20630 [Pseudomonadota bacterium]
MFDDIPNKTPAIEPPQSLTWPELGPSCEINQFYTHFESASGFIGAGYIEVWERALLPETQRSAAVVYPGSFRFFASDGGGNMFGVTITEEGVKYLSAPNIGGLEDVRYFDSWSDLLAAIRDFNYI